MKRLSFTVLFCLLFAQSAFAALPPLYQTRDEIMAVLSSPDFDQKLESGEVIMSIKKIQEGYEIETNKSKVKAILEYEKMQKAGPIRFKVKFLDPKKIS